MLDPFALPFVQRGLLEVVALAIAAGLLGTWIVLRGLAFYAHAVGTAAFPGLVLAAGLGVSALLGALVTAAVVAGVVGGLARRERGAEDSLTALVLVGALALGVILASDVFKSPGGVDQLLFGSPAGWRTASIPRAPAPRACARGCPTPCCSRWWRSRRSRRCGSPARCWPAR